MGTAGLRKFRRAVGFDQSRYRLIGKIGKQGGQAGTLHVNQVRMERGLHFRIRACRK